MIQKAAVIGAQGYSGRELARLLVKHPKVELAGLFTTQSDWHISHDLPELENTKVAHYKSENLAQHQAEFDIFFLATPPEISMQLAPQLLQQKKLVIDLSGAFRLNLNDFEVWYATQHKAEDLIFTATYGLSPWWINKNKVIDSNLIANPGCYATCALMALLPLFEYKVIKPDNIIIDAKSGVSGAGRQANKNLLFAELDNNFFPYKIGKHQHTPEIIKYIDKFTDQKSEPVVSTSLLPVKRGISMSIYADPDSSIDSDQYILSAIENAYKSSYAGYKLVKFAKITGDPKVDQKILALKHVVGSARVHIGYYVKNNKVMLFANIDNLLKGAASQAIENLNAIFNLPVETGLEHLEGML